MAKEYWNTLILRGLKSVSAAEVGDSEARHFNGCRNQRLFR